MVESLVAVRDRREYVIARLSDGYASDLFDVDELDRRLDLAHAARTIAELDALIADLAPVAAPTAAALVPIGVHAIDDPGRPDAKRLRVIMGSIERRGPWTVAKHLTTRVLWGSAKLDFREASIGPGVTTLDIHIVMGSLELILPPWLSIDVDVSSFAASVEERHRVSAEPDPSRPILRVTGEVWLGSVEISTRLPGESQWAARRRERRERKKHVKALRAGNPLLPPGR